MDSAITATVEGEVDDNWLEDLALIEIRTREKGFKEGYKVGEQLAATLGLSTGVEVAGDPGYEYGCLSAFSQAFLDELKIKEEVHRGHSLQEEQFPILVSLVKEIAHKINTDPEDVLQVNRELEGIRFKIDLYYSQFPILKLLKLEKDESTELESVQATSSQSQSIDDLY